VLGDPITTATDVYAIGVLLYQLLSGRLPYARAESGAVSYQKAVVEEAPEPVHRAISRPLRAGDDTPTGEALAAARGTSVPALRRSLRGDLDRIVQRSLAKRPESRYQSVAELAADLRAFSAGRAISGSSRRYRLRMFVRRHWLPLAAASVLLLVLLVSAATMVLAIAPDRARGTEHVAGEKLPVRFVHRGRSARSQGPRGQRTRVAGPRRRAHRAEQRARYPATRGNPSRRWAALTTSLACSIRPASCSRARSRDWPRRIRAEGGFWH
jgi:serine/threonine protein kinase